MDYSDGSCDEGDDVTVDSEDKLQNRLMRQALNYQATMKGGLKGKNEVGEEMFLASLADGGSFTKPIERCSGVGAYANPYMEIFNVASSLTGTYPFETVSLEDRKRLEERNEPIFYMNEPLIDGEDDLRPLREDMVDSTDAVSELTELSKDIVSRVPVTRHLKPEVVTKERGVRDDGASGEPGDGKVSSVMKLYVRQAVEAQIVKWRKEGRIATDDVDGLASRLQREACLNMSSMIRRHITGDMQSNQM